MDELFSRRFRVRPTPEGLIFDSVPNETRIGLYYLIEEFFNELGAGTLYTAICSGLRVERNPQYGLLNALYCIKELVKSCQWWQVYDICEIVWQELESTKRAKYSNKINSILTEDCLGFRIDEKNGVIERVSPGFINTQIKEARYLLSESRFKGADEHFEKAIKALNIRPKPDVENCIKDAVAAIESVGRILINDEKALLSDAVTSMVTEGTIPKPLDQTIQKLYAYRGNEQGVSHGLVGDSKVTIHEAEFVLAMSAAMIIYLVNKNK